MQLFCKPVWSVDNVRKIYDKMRVEEVYKGNLDGAIVKISEFHEGQMKSKFPGEKM